MNVHPSIRQVLNGSIDKMEPRIHRRSLLGWVQIYFLKAKELDTMCELWRSIDFAMQERAR